MVARTCECQRAEWSDIAEQDPCDERLAHERRDSRLSSAVYLAPSVPCACSTRDASRWHWSVAGARPGTTTAASRTIVKPVPDDPREDVAACTSQRCQSLQTRRAERHPGGAGIIAAASGSRGSRAVASRRVGKPERPLQECPAISCNAPVPGNTSGSTRHSLRLPAYHWSEKNRRKHA